jgi:protein involved in polysaccharide export with SLBB domain
MEELKCSRSHLSANLALAACGPVLPSGIRRLLSAVVLALICFGCSHTNSPIVVTSGARAGTEPLTKLSVGDTVHVEIFELITPGLNWSESMIIDANGNIAIRNLGAIHAAGLTTEQLAAKIEFILAEKGSFGAPPPTPPIKVTRQLVATTAPLMEPAHKLPD